MTYLDVTELEVTPTDWIPENSIIKVIGVGGGGCNAVNYMYNRRIEGCTFIVCNTDSQSLKKSPVPIKIQLGSGLGAGCNPTEGRNAALNSQQEIEEKVLNTKTDMLFITAGMGGGTGTGAAPVIAAMAKNKGILTVGVVTIPFKNEGNESMSKAIDGIYELQKNVDSLSSSTTRRSTAITAVCSSRRPSLRLTKCLQQLCRELPKSSTSQDMSTWTSRM